MKFNNLFRNRRNIYFTVLIVTALLLAGGVWQYRNFLVNQNAQLELKKSLEEMYGAEEKSYTGIEVIRENANGENQENPPIKEVVNTDNRKPVAMTNNNNEAKNNPEEKAISAIKMQPKMETMVVPVLGSIIKDFSDQNLIYCSTLDQWTTHHGLDIKADEGSPVRAAMDGIVTELKNDPELGLTILLDHGSGIQTKYANLSTLDLVTLGQSIKKGDVISGVGRTALYEINDPPHLHFEVIKNEKSIDPKQFLPKQSLKN